MRQAGRTLPAYRQIRASHSLGSLFRTPHLAASITQMPVDLLGVDAAIVFADILLIWEAFSLEVCFPEQGKPHIIYDSNPVLSLPPPRIESLEYVADTIRQVKPHLDVPLIGFCGGPWTVIQFLFSKEKRASQMKWPSNLTSLLEQVAQASLLYLKMQVAAGADAIQIFETLADQLSDEQFTLFAAPYLRYLVEGIRSLGIPCIVYGKSSSLRPDLFVSIDPDAVSFDWHRPLFQLRREFPSLTLQGNLNPSLLHESPHEVEKLTRCLLQKMEGDSAFIANLGHGLLPDTPLASIRTFVDTIRQF